MSYRRIGPILATSVLVIGCHKFPFTGLDLSGRTRSLQVSGTCSNANGSPTILRIRVLLDGHEVSDIALQQSSSQAHLYGFGGGDRGHHRLLFVLTEQTASPSTYRFSGLRVALVDADLLGGGPTLASVDLPERMESLETGAAAGYEFDL